MTYVALMTEKSVFYFCIMKIVLKWHQQTANCDQTKEELFCHLYVKTVISRLITVCFLDLHATDCSFYNIDFHEKCSTKPSV